MDTSERPRQWGGGDAIIPLCARHRRLRADWLQAHHRNRPLSMVGADGGDVPYSA